MLENNVITGTWIPLVHLATALLTLTILALILQVVRQILLAPPLLRLEPPANPAIATATASTKASNAAMLVAAKKAEASLKPGRSCGHCGVRIKGDPIRGIALDEKSFLVYACPECKKETLLPQ